MKRVDTQNSNGNSNNGNSNNVCDNNVCDNNVYDNISDSSIDTDECSVFLDESQENNSNPEREKYSEKYGEKYGENILSGNVMSGVQSAYTQELITAKSTLTQEKNDTGENSQVVHNLSGRHLYDNLSGKMSANLSGSQVNSVNSFRTVVVSRQFDILKLLDFIKTLSSKVTVSGKTLKTRRVIITLEHSIMTEGTGCTLRNSNSITNNTNTSNVDTSLNSSLILTVKTTDLIDLLKHTNTFNVTHNGLSFIYTEDVNNTVVTYDREIKYEEVDLFNIDHTSIEEPENLYRVCNNKSSSNIGGTDDNSTNGYDVTGTNEIDEFDSVYGNFLRILSNDSSTLSFTNHSMVIKSNNLFLTKNTIHLNKLDDRENPEDMRVKGKDLRIIEKFNKFKGYNGDIVLGIFNRCIVVYKFKESESEGGSYMMGVIEYTK